MKKLLLSTSLSLAAFIFIGCGGSGGGPSVPAQPVITPTPDTNTTIPDTNTTTPDTPIEPVVPPSGPGVDYTDPSQFPQTTNIPNHLAQVNAQVAYDNGYTGGNLSESQTYTTVASDTSNRNLQTIVAVLDSGINASHEDLNGTKVIGFKDFTSTNSSTPYDDIGHGTMVAHLIAGARQDQSDTYYGMAYGAQLLVGQVIENGTTDNFKVQEGIDWVVQQKALLDIQDQRKLVSLNLSLGTTDSAFVDASFKTSLVNALSSGISMVIAAGNEGLICQPIGGTLNGHCSFPAAAPWVSGSADTDYFNKEGGWVVVGSVDSNNNISSFSNKAGVTKSNYLVAPGENLTGAAYNQNDGYRVGSGTSFATSLVSGALALMAQRWDHLNGRQHTQILFDTATDLGDAGIDDIYGNGLLNLTQAFSPVGTVIIPAGVSNVFTQNGTKSVTNTRIKTSSAILNLSSLTSLNNTIGVDYYNRDFQTNLTTNMTTSGVSPIDFRNFMTFNYKNYIFGVDQVNNMPLVGYKLSKDSKIKLSYDNTFLGTEAEGALSLGHSNTVYLGYDKTLLEKESFSFNLSTTYAYAKTKTDSQSLISQASDVHALGGEITAKYDNFGLSYEIPLRTVSGTMTFNTPTGIDQNGFVEYTKTTADLKPETFQQTYSIFFEKRMIDLYVLARLSRTADAFGIDNLINNEAKISINYVY